MDRKSPDSDFRLRRMTVDDLTAVAGIEESAFEGGWPRTAFEHELTANAVARYVLLERVAQGCSGGAPLGFAGLWLQFDQAHIVTVAVEPSVRRSGYGSLLVLALLNIASAAGMSDATLEVRASNVAARALYARHGFFEVGERRRYYADNGEDAVIMTTRELTSPALHDIVARRQSELAARIPGFSTGLLDAHTMGFDPLPDP